MLKILIILLFALAIYSGWKVGRKEPGSPVRRIAYGVFGAAWSVLIINVLFHLFTSFKYTTEIYWVCLAGIVGGLLVGTIAYAREEQKGKF